MTSGGKRICIKLTEPELDRIAELWAQGHSASKIAAIVKTHSRNGIFGVVTRARENGDKRFAASHHAKTHWTDDQLLHLLHLRETEGRDWRDVGQTLGKNAGECRAQFDEIIRETEAHER